MPGPGGDDDRRGVSQHLGTAPEAPTEGCPWLAGHPGGETDDFWAEPAVGKTFSARAGRLPSMDWFHLIGKMANYAVVLMQRFLGCNQRGLARLGRDGKTLAETTSERVHF